MELQQKILTGAEVFHQRKGEKLKRKLPKEISPSSEINTLKLFHKLEVQKKELVMQNVQLRQAKEKVEESEHKLKERIKELKGIYSLGQLAEKSEILEDIYNEFVNIIVPESMSYPENVLVSLEIEDKSYCNVKDFRLLKIQTYLSAPIIFFEKNQGELIVAYGEDLPFIDIFEQHLINNLAGKISKITERIITKQALRESESLLKNAQQVAKMGSWEWDRVSKKSRWSENYFAIIGFKSAFIEPTLEFFRTLVHKDDVHTLDEAHTKIIREHLPVSFNIRLIQPDNTIKWIQNNVAPVIKNDKIAGLKGVIIDITDRKQKDEKIIKVNQSLKKLNSRLIQIREEERASISREIHDQIGQSLTAIKIDTFWLLGQKATEPEVSAKLNGMLDMITGTILDVQRISSELRPAMLDDLGLSAALEWYCEEFVNRTGLKVNMEFEKVQSENMNANLSLYRVLQESLTNIIRHSGAKNVLVKLSRIKNNLLLLINDDGIGISRDKLNSSRSLGILGMFERIRFSDGHIEITTPEQGGTQIIVNIPFE